MKTVYTRPFVVILWVLALFFTGCYSFRDVNSIPPEIKTFKVNYIENRSRGYVNPQLSPQLTDKLRQKIVNQTRLSPVQGDDADYDIKGEITDYTVSTSGVSNQQAVNNRLTVSVRILFTNRKDEKKNFDASISRSFDFSANLTLQQAEGQLMPTILQNVTDEIFNRIFSNW